MKICFINEKEVGAVEFGVEMHKSLKKEFKSNDYKFIKELMTDNQKSLEEFGRTNIGGTEFAIYDKVIDKEKMIELLDIVNNKEDYFEYESQNAYDELKGMIEDL